MSFVFRGSRADIEAGGFSGFAPERRAMVGVCLLNP
jgi:E3 ubiquitin-protein ligase SDIR1